MSRRPTPAAAARKKAQLYLTPLRDAAGAVLGWRFAPGPALRARGLKSQILRHPDGRFYTFEAAQAFRDAALSGAQPAIQPAAPARTLDALWAAYLAAKTAECERGEEGALRPQTLRAYRLAIKPWLALAGDEPAGALDAEMVEQAYKDQRARGVSHHMAILGVAALSALFSFAKRKGWRGDNPCQGLRLARPEGRLRLGAPHEMKALVEAADAMGLRAVGDAIVAALWTAQRQGDLLACDLGRQLIDGRLVFARVHGGDFSQAKTGGRALVKILPPLRMRLGERRSGLLCPAPGGSHWRADAFRRAYQQVRAEAARTCPSLADFQFRDLRDTAVTRLHLAKIELAHIAIWSGHSLAAIGQILEEHYLVATGEAADDTADQLETWRLKQGVVW